MNANDKVVCEAMDAWIMCLEHMVNNVVWIGKRPEGLTKEEMFQHVKKCSYGVPANKVQPTLKGGKLLNTLFESRSLREHMDKFYERHPEGVEF